MQYWYWWDTGWIDRKCFTSSGGHWFYRSKKFKFQSFPTISSTGPNGAIVHYNASKRTNRVLEQGNIYLVDSGGQYHYGTTDVTRTISLDTKSKKIKEIFTRVLQGHLNLSNFKIEKNTSGSILDQVARKKLKSINLFRFSSIPLEYIQNEFFLLLPLSSNLHVHIRNRVHELPFAQ